PIDVFIHKIDHCTVLQLDMNSVINERCTFIEQHKDTISLDNLKSLFDDIVQELEKTKLNDRLSFLKQLRPLISTIMDNISYLKLANPILLEHQLIRLFLNTYIDLLMKWSKNINNNNNNNDVVLDNDEEFLFREISVRFVWLISELNKLNFHIFKKLFIDKILIDLIQQCLDDIATNGKYLNDANLENLSYIIRILNEITHYEDDIQDDPILLPIIDSVIKCLCSKYYLETFKELLPSSTSTNELNVKQNFLLIACGSYFSNYIGKRRE
ncbi:unnamed protein product, partial [Didymodactylos carnosus]